LLDPEQTIATPEEVPPNVITAARPLLAGLLEQDTFQIDFYAEEPSEEQVVEARQRERAATDLVTRRKPPKHNNTPAQPMLAFDQILADLETKLLQHKPEIMPPGWVQDLARKPTPETQLTAFLSTNKQITTVEPESMRTTQSLLQPAPTTIDVWIITITIPFPILWVTNAISNLSVQFPIIPPTIPFLSTVNPPQTQTNEPRPSNNETLRDQQGSIQPSQQTEQAAIQTVERP
ncbi:MAG: hypothetical protein EZS28_032810, partial [Streblomastix strix]